MSRRLRYNLFLHFFDRELRLSVNCDSSERDVLGSILVATCLVPGRLFCSYSHLWESASLLQGSTKLIELLVQLDLLVPASDYVTADEFLDSRQVLYAHDSSRYPFYFKDADGSPIAIQPAYRTSKGATAFLERYLAEKLPQHVFATAAGDEATIRRCIERGLFQRDGRAITGSLFGDVIGKERRLLPAIRRAISFGYVSHYLSQCSADILTGFKGLSIYDSLSIGFPCYDVRLFGTLLDAAGFAGWRSQAPLALLESAIHDRHTPGHPVFLEEWRQLISSFQYRSAASAHQTSLGDIGAELRRRAVVARPRPLEAFRATRRIRPLAAAFAGSVTHRKWSRGTRANG